MTRGRCKPARRRNLDRPLRICGIVPVYCHPEWRGSGVARTATDLLWALAQRGNRVTVLSPAFDHDHRFDDRHEASLLEGCFVARYCHEARPTRFGTSRGRLRELLTPLLPQVDVVHIHSFMSPWTDTAARMALRAGVPYIIQDHGKLSPGVLRNRGLVKRLYLLLKGSRLLRSAARVVPSAPCVADAIHRWDPAIRAEACTNGLDPAEFEGSMPPRPIAEPYILFFGWLDPRKNPALIVRSFGRVAARMPQWKLAMVGPDSYGTAESLRELAAELGIPDRVVMPGMARGADKMAWLKNAGMFVLPSEGEGLSLAMLEAMACGLPCLLSEGCNYPEIEAAGAGRVLRLAEEDWSEAMHRYGACDSERLQAGSRARQLFMDRHVLSSVGAVLEQLLRRAIAG